MVEITPDPATGQRADRVTKYVWAPMLERLKLPAVRLYDARHGCATMLLEAGRPMKVVQENRGMPA